LILYSFPFHTHSLHIQRRRRGNREERMGGKVGGKGELGGTEGYGGEVKGAGRERRGV